MHDALYAYLIYIPADFVARLITNQPTQLSSRLYLPSWLPDKTEKFLISFKVIFAVIHMFANVTVYLYSY